MPRQYAAHSPPVALTIAGSDSGGGAGIQADLKTMEAHDAFGTSVVTATTAQNTQGVEDVNVLSTEHIAAQYEAVIADFDVSAIKTGMLATDAVIKTVVDCVADFAGPIVVDPVMVAATGDRLLSEDAESAYETLLGYATLATPNVDEAEILTETEITDSSDAEQAGRHLLELGVDAALVKGGHLQGEEVVDTLVVATDGEPRVERFSHPRVDAAGTHGSGCTLSSAIAARLAGGAPLIDAVADGVAFMEQAVRYGIDTGEGPGSVHHLVDIRERAGRSAVSDAVESVVARLVDRNVETLVPAVGMGIVGASRFAEQPADVVGVDGRLTPTCSGIQPTAGVRAGGSPALARELLAARELFPELRFALNCRFDGSVETALETLDGPVVESSGPEPAGVESLDYATPVVRLDDAARPPAAVIDRGGEGRPAGVVVLATAAETLIERTLRLHDALITE